MPADSKWKQWKHPILECTMGNVWIEPGEVEVCLVNWKYVCMFGKIKVCMLGKIKVCMLGKFKVCMYAW